MSGRIIAPGDEHATEADIQLLRDAGVIHVNGKGPLTKADVESLIDVAEAINQDRKRFEEKVMGRSKSMSGRISDERLDELALGCQFFADDPRCAGDRDAYYAFEELKQSRALVTELRALAERMNEFDAERQWFGSSCAIEGIEDATTHWHSELTSLLAAHDAQQAATSFCVETAAASIALHQAEMQRREAEVHLVASQDLTKDDADMIISVVGLLDAQQAEGKAE